ncbi:hypothetical protein HZ992_01795 [Rhizobacter sp. AJA081-3]|uniref:hypothetical protein n=1 Tax=Rhizobacter sp. AJA081-3 TaxID=2753607 RepID=UPI001AE064D6|nr:hypothetical protein [Rhizobacter sp. AJA081-3]QTN23763.1 hypothetical protein HZ992_01795 [Rhizobacter sp. AJA081-3]
MTTPIIVFFLVGALFGLATGSVQHLFSEGRARPAEPGEPVSLASRALWVLISSCLWPILLLAGVPTLYRLVAVRVRAPRGQPPRE